MTTTEPATSWELVARAQAGDAGAFGQLYGRYREMVFRYTLFRTSNRAIADDLTADTFERAWKRIDTVTYQGRDIGAWLVTIARNLVLDHHKCSRTKLTTYIGPGEPFWDTALRGEPPLLPEQRVIVRETVEELDRMVSALNPRQQDVIRYRFYDGHSVVETAALMGCEEGASKALQGRAVKALARSTPARTVVEFTDGTAA